MDCLSRGRHRVDVRRALQRDCPSRRDSVEGVMPAAAGGGVHMHRRYALQSHNSMISSYFLHWCGVAARLAMNAVTRTSARRRARRFASANRSRRSAVSRSSYGSTKAGASAGPGLPRPRRPHVLGVDPLGSCRLSLVTGDSDCLRSTGLSTSPRRRRALARCAKEISEQGAGRRPKAAKGQAANAVPIFSTRFPKRTRCPTLFCVARPPVSK